MRKNVLALSLGLLATVALSAPAFGQSAERDGLGVGLSVGAANGLNTSVGLGGSDGVNADVDASLGGANGVNADANATVGGSRGVNADAQASVGGSNGINADADIGLGGDNGLNSSVDASVGGRRGLTAGLDVNTGGGGAGVGSGGAVSPGAPLTAFNKLSSAERVKLIKRCRDVVSGGYDGGLVSLCRILQASASR